ncbi:MAG: class I SAM-dependent methyltransferase [Chlamydiia bacterium]|nr:class I SAM-dependent methyltransferase [Chlamydiia bacterium]
MAHQIWERHLRAGQRAVDATCGNGHDTAFLAGLGLSHIYACDIQEKALEMTKKRLKGFKNISYHLGCHSCFEGVAPGIALLVYNLGYLPGSDKEVVTCLETTLISVKKGLSLLQPQGMVSLTLYSGHAEGEREKKARLDWGASLSKGEYEVSHHCLLNRKTAPSLLVVKKIF